MKRKGCSIIFVNEHNEILLLLRDDNPNIPYPNMWDLPGGHVEDNETPKQCIVREIKEEMDLNIEGTFQPFTITVFTDRIEHTFWQNVRFDIDRIKLTEGQCLGWFSSDAIETIELACGFNQVVRDFFRKKPFRS